MEMPILWPLRNIEENLRKCPKLLIMFGYTSYKLIIFHIEGAAGCIDRSARACQ